MLNDQYHLGTLTLNCNIEEIHNNAFSRSRDTKRCARAHAPHMTCVKCLADMSLTTHQILAPYVQPGTYLPRICRRGGGTEVCGGPSVTSFKIKSLRIWTTISKGVPFYERKKRNKYEKKFDLGPTQIATGDPVTSKLEPHGLQRSPNGPIC